MLAGGWRERACYRWAQGWSALRARVDEPERAAALVWLPGPARVVFRSLPAADQCHHLAVYRRLWALGCRDGDLLAAALLHDIGKVDGRRCVRLWQRVVVVLLRPWPAVLGRLAVAPPNALRYGFYLHAHHPALGASQAAALGCSDRTVALIAAHQSGDLPDDGLAVLRAVDDGA
ncbi:MAG: hypothetical protein IT340_13885 [Chloroflexi bacterium]|nr:hypothetical protein [Chloroflexota bacterium]